MTLRVLQSDALTDSFIQSLSTVRLSLILELGRLETETLLGDACEGASLTILANSFPQGGGGYMDVHFTIC